MFRPHISSAPAHRPVRRGTILIVVLALLALFAVIALFFVFFADAEATNARIMREAESYNGNDAAALDQSAFDAANVGLSQMIFGVPFNQLSGLYGQDLTTLMYTHLPGQSPPFAGIGTFHEPVPGIGTADRATWVNYSAFAYGAGGVPFFLDPEWSGSRSPSNPVQGAAWWSAGPSSAFGQTFIPKNAGYTYPDLNNFILASISPATGQVLVPSLHRPWLFNLAPQGFGGNAQDWLAGEGRTRTVRPRPVDQLTAAELQSIIGVPYLPATLNAGQIASLNNYIQSQIAQGNLIGYPPPNADNSFTGDVQNLVGGVGVQRNDSILVDLGLPPRQWNGKWVKPLVSILVSDLDGLLNLNVHGNVRNNGGPGSGLHASFHGLGPHEVNLGSPSNVFGGPLLNSEAQNLVFARYGSAGAATARNGGPFGNNTYFYDRSGSRIKQESQVNFDGGFAGIVPQLFLPSFASSNAFQVSPSYGTAGQSFYDDNVYDGAVMSPPAGYVADSYNKYDKHPLLFNPNDYGPNNTGAPRTFGFGDFKRFNFKYAATLDWYQQTNMYNPSGLANASLIGTFPANNAYRLDPAHTRRMMATMRSSGFDRPSLAPNFLTVQGPSGMTPSQALNFLQPVNPLAGGMPYPSQAMYPQTPYPGTSPAALPPTPGQISDYQAMDFRHVRAGYGAGLGGIDLNRPLTSYYPPNTAPTPGVAPANLAQAWADRHNLARDIFARLIVATGATAIVDTSTGTSTSGNITLPQPTGTPNQFNLQINAMTSIPITQIEYNALRYLAQMSANMVDLIDNDDINTPFIWNPPGGVLTQVNSTNVATPQTSLMAGTTINNTNAVSDRMVFGVEKPKLIISEAYGEITNDPNEQTTANAAPMFAAHVRFWVELINPGNAAYANNGNGPQGAPLPTPATPGNGAAQVRYEAADGVTPPYSPYNLTITRFNKTGTVAGTTENVRQYLQDPSNVLGAYMPPGGTPADLIYDFSNNVNAANSGRIVSPNNGHYGPNLTPAQGCLIVGPQVPPAQMAGNMTGPQPFEFTPQAAVAPWAQMYQSPQQIGVMPQAAPSNLMEYLIPIPSSGPGVGNPPVGTLGGQDFAQHVVLLRRLANPYMLPNDPTSGAFNPALPANPYITVDYMDYVPAFDAVNRTMNESTNNQRQPKAGGPPPSGVNAYDPPGYRFSVGKIQPFASLSFNSMAGPAANTTLPNTSYSYLTSCVLPQIPPGGLNAAAATVTAFTFGRHNGTQNTDLYTPGTSTALPNNTSETILAPFDWFVHFDRPLINQMELLHLQACKPHEVTQFTTQPMVPAPAGPGPMAPAVNYMKNLGVAQWFGVNSTGFSGYDTTNNRTNNGLFRALEVLRVKPWMYGVGSGGRTQGQVNINTAQDPRILQSVLDGVPPQWAANTPYQQGQLVSNGGSAYMCITAGTSGPTGPTGFTSPIVDGSVQWSYYRPAGNGFTVNDVASLWNNGFNSPAPTAGIPYRTRNCTTAASPFPAPFSQGQLANGTQLNVPIPSITMDDANPSDHNYATNIANFLYDRPFKPFGYPEFSLGGLYGMSAGSGLQDTLLRINPANSNPLFWVNSPTVNGVQMQHPYMKAEMLRKMFNNSTTVSNAFAVTMTVVFYEVRSNGSGGYLTVADGGGVVQRPALGKEAFVYAPGDLRQQFYAVVDRTMIGIQPSGTGWQPQPFYTSLGAATPTALTAAGLSPGTMVPILPAPTTPPMGFLPPQFPNSFNVYLDNDGPSPSGPAQPYTTNYASTGTIYSNGVPITIGPGTTLVIGSGTNQEVVGVNYVNQDGSVNVSTAPLHQHAVGEVVSNCLLGNPGLPGITPGMPAFDRFTNPSSSNFTSVVPYVWRKPKE